RQRDTCSKESRSRESYSVYLWHDTEGLDRLTKDWTDSLLDRLADNRSPKEIEPYQVTARISRVGLHIARMQEDAFGRFGLNRGEVGVLGALLLAGPKQQLSPTQLFKGLMISSAGMTSRVDCLVLGGYVMRTSNPYNGRGVMV